MSARPSMPRLSEEDLDLLISRSLDGDLSPEEELDLLTVLTLDPAAARRKDALARVVAETRALPEPAPPFALATRVNSNVSEKASRPGAVWHRFGFYPPRGFAAAVMVMLGFVAIGITVMKPAAKNAAPGGVASVVAQSADRAVDVFFSETKPEDAAKAPEAGRIAAKESAPGQPARNERQSAARAPAAIVAMGPADEEKRQIEADKDSSRAHGVAERAPASIIASNEPVGDALARKKLAKTEKAEGNLALENRFSVEGATVTSASPVLVASASAPQAAGGVVAQGEPQANAAGATKAMRANVAPAPASAPTWSVAVRGEGARRWMLRQAPQGRTSAALGQISTFRVTLNADGRVTSVRALDARPANPSLLEFVRGLVFTQTAAVLDAGARDEKAKAERADAVADAPASSEIEVEVSAH